MMTTLMRDISGIISRCIIRSHFMLLSFCVTYNTDAMSGHGRILFSGSAVCEGILPGIPEEFGRPENLQIGRDIGLRLVSPS